MCGYLHSEDPLFDPAMRALPPVFVVRLPRRPGRRLGAGQHRLRARGGGAAVEREHEPDRHPAARAGADRGAARAPRDRAGRRPRLDRRAARPGARRRRCRCCTARRRATGRWPTSRRAPRCRARCSTSASARCSGRSPIRYLTEWRMHLADELLGHHRPRRRQRRPPASATTPRRRSAARSSASGGSRRATGGPRGRSRSPPSSRSRRAIISMASSSARSGP